MPKYDVTPEMGIMLKTLRIKKNIKAVEIADKIGKTGAFISKLENGSLNTIKSEDFFSILSYLTDENEKKELDYIITSILNDTKITFSKKESETEEWLLNLDYFYRTITVPKTYTNYVNKYIADHKINIIDLINYMNSNIDLYKNSSFSKELLDNSQKNYWYFNNGHSYALIHVEQEEIMQLLLNEIKHTNYSILKCILISLYRLSNVNINEAYSLAEEELSSMNILTIHDKNKIMNAYEGLDTMHTLLDQRNNDNLPETDRILYTNLYNLTNDCISFAELYDMEYANEKLSTLLKNFQIDPVLTMGLLGINLTSLKDCDINTKREFINEINSLIQKYQSMKISPKTELI